MTILRRLKSKASPLIKIPLVNALRGVPLPSITGDAAQRAIAHAIVCGSKLVARVGETEGATIGFYLERRLGRASPAAYPARLRHLMKEGSGLFPTTDAMIDRFAEITLAAIEASDLYAAWTPHDRRLAPRGVQRLRLFDLDPFFGARRWTLALEGRRVTVLSPFKASILRQYPKRDALFDQPTLPTFDLTVVQAPQTQVRADISGQDWLAHLDRLDREIAAGAPDVVLIGAGGYGLPLAARAKQRGSTAIVLGGITQLLFGIYGNRWLNDPAYRRLINPAWCRPSVEERPPGHDTFEVQGGAYW